MRENDLLMVEHAGTAMKCLKLIDFNLLNVTNINKVLNTFKIEPRGEDKRATYTREKKTEINNEVPN